MNSSSALAAQYSSLGFRPVPIPLGSKGPVLKNWPAYDFNPLDFEDGCNVGIILGNGIICIDLDCELAVEMAKQYLPPTDCIIGRGKRPRCHWFYRCDLPNKSHKLHLDTGVITVVDVLCKNKQVVVGPSIHPSGDKYDAFEGEPSKVDPEILREKVAGLFAAVREAILDTGAQEIQRATSSRVVQEIHRDNSDAPGTAYSREHPGDLLTKHGWSFLSRNSSGKEHWSRPGKSPAGISADLSVIDGVWKFYLYTSSAPYLEQGKAYSPHALLAVLEFNGDFGAAASHLRQLGYGANEIIDDPCPGLNQTRFEIAEDIGAPDPVSEFPRECLTYPGFIQMVVEHNLKTTGQKQPELAIGSALALLSTIVGNRVKSFCNYTTLPNLFVLALGKTGSGKDHGRRINKRILEESGFSDLLGSSQIGSDAGLLTALEANPVKLYQLDEVGDFLQMTKAAGAASYLTKIAPLLKELKTSAGGYFRGPALAAGSKELRHPYLTILATTTPSGFWESITKSQARDGLLSRFLIFESPGYTKATVAIREDTPPEIIRLVKWWRNEFSPQGNLDPSYIWAEVEPAAMERFIIHEEQIRERQIEDDKVDSMRAELWSRTSENTNQLALLAACSRVTGQPGEIPKITLDDMNWAIRLSNYQTRKMVGRGHEQISENDWERDLKKVKANLHDGISKSKLAYKCQTIQPKRLKEAIDHLLLTGEISAVETTKPKIGRPKTVYRIKNSKPQ
jgi:hypothetical protein